MSGQRLPVFIDPIRMADTKVRLSGVVMLKDMARLCQLSAQPDGEIHVDLRFGIDQQGYRYIDGHIKTEVSLICQRCLETFAYPIDSNFMLSPVTDDVAAKLLPSHYEPLLTTEKVLLSAVVEDEILLNLPLVARHEIADCPVKVALEPEIESSKKSKPDNPFKKLATLRKRKS